MYQVVVLANSNSSHMGSKAITLDMRLAEGSSKTAHRLTFSKIEIVIGRSENSDIQLPDSSVSIVHAKILRKDSGADDWFVQDLRSTNGTALDGKKVEGDKANVLGMGSQIYIGRFCLTRVPSGNSDQNDAAVKNPKNNSPKHESTASLARALMRDMSEKIAGAKKRIFIENSPRFPEAIVIEQNSSLTVGRDIKCEISIDDPDLSRKHIQLTDSKEGLVVSDLSSKNGTYVNNEKIQMPYTLKHDDRVRIGSTEFRFAEENLELLEELQHPLRYTSYALDDIAGDSQIASQTPHPGEALQKGNTPIEDMSTSSSKEGIDWLFIIPALILVATATATIIYLAR